MSLDLIGTGGGGHYQMYAVNGGGAGYNSVPGWPGGGAGAAAQPSGGSTTSARYGQNGLVVVEY